MAHQIAFRIRSGRNHGVKGPQMNGMVLKDMLGRIAERGRALVEKRSSRLAAFAAPGPASNSGSERIEDLCRALLSGRGEASGVALASKVLDRYATMSNREKTDFFYALAKDFGPDHQGLKQAGRPTSRLPTVRDCESCSAQLSRRARSCFA